MALFVNLLYYMTFAPMACCYAALFLYGATFADVLFAEKVLVTSTSTTMPKSTLKSVRSEVCELKGVCMLQTWLLQDTTPFLQPSFTDTSFNGTVFATTTSFLCTLHSVAGEFEMVLPANHQLMCFQQESAVQLSGTIFFIDSFSQDIQEVMPWSEPPIFRDKFYLQHPKLSFGPPEEKVARSHGRWRRRWRWR